MQTFLTQYNYGATFRRLYSSCNRYNIQGNIILKETQHPFQNKRISQMLKIICLLFTFLMMGSLTAQDKVKESKIQALEISGTELVIPFSKTNVQ